jgi:site-specific DNA-cytosine methylase
MSRGLKVLSLFDGISCGMVALERVEIPVERYVAYEIDKYAIQVSKANYPQIEQMGDVTTADFTQYKGFDLLIGGSPCQSLSIVQSKTRQNLDGKSKLFFEYVRAKEQMQPKYFLFENVASMNKESKQTISNCLGCEPILINSADFSAQERPRLYWTNIPILRNHTKSNLVLKDIMESNVDEKYFYNYPLLNVDLSKQVCAIMDFKNHDMHKRIFNPSFKMHTLTTCGGGNTQKKVYDNGRARKLTPLEYERLQTLPDNYTSCVSDSRRYSAIGNGWTVDVIVHILKGLKEELSR